MPKLLGLILLEIIKTKPHKIEVLKENTMFLIESRKYKNNTLAQKIRQWENNEAEENRFLKSKERYLTLKSWSAIGLKPDSMIKTSWREN